MDIVANAKSARLAAAELLSQAQARDLTGSQEQATTWKRSPGRILIPVAAPASQPRDNTALEQAAMNLAQAHAKLAAYDDKGVMSFESIAVSAELRACMAGLAAITSYLSSSNLAAGASAALDLGQFHKTPGGLWVPTKTD